MKLDKHGRDDDFQRTEFIRKTAIELLATSAWADSCEDKDFVIIWKRAKNLWDNKPEDC